MRLSMAVLRVAELYCKPAFPINSPDPLHGKRKIPSEKVNID